MDASVNLETHKIQGLRISVVSLEDRACHFQEEWEIIWIWEGKLQLKSSGQNYILLNNDLAILAPNTVYDFIALNKKSSFLSARVSRERFPEIGAKSFESPCISKYLSYEESVLARKKLWILSKEYLEQEQFYEFKCLEQICALLYLFLTKVPFHENTIECEENCTKKEERLSRLRNYVESGFMHKINLSDFAASEGCSLSYMSHFVKDAMNQSFQEYVSLIRYRYACKLIQTGENNMLEVCMESGFSDYRYFVKTFRKMCGMTPDEYSRNKNAVLQIPINEAKPNSKEYVYSTEQSLSIMDKWMTKLIAE